MWRATPELVRALRQRYEDTDQLMTSIAAEFEMSNRTLGRMVQMEGWRKRSDRLRGLPKAVQLLEEATALAAKPPEPPTPTPSPPLAALVEGGESSAIERLEALVVQEIAAAEAARAQVTDKRQLAKVSDKNARTLSTLTQTLRTLQQMRTGKPLEPEMNDDDDMPRDLDEFRRALARRIAAFMESRPDDGDAVEDRDAARLDDVS